MRLFLFVMFSLKKNHVFQLRNQKVAYICN